ncbi:MAG: hypothetical protein HYU64_03885 [Armatimonadetes bacterium]|nr:hypothetical protein [Armatimonadota bacterium]
MNSLMISRQPVGEFIRSASAGKSEFSGDHGINKIIYGLAAAETLAGAGIGYTLGAQHAARDVVTHETVMREVTRSVFDHFTPVVVSTDPLIISQMPVYRQVPTGQYEPVAVTNHSEPFPHTAVQGLITGAIIGAAAGLLTIAAVKLHEIVNE